MPENTPENEMPGAFMQGLRNKNENAGKHIFHTDENLTFGQIAEREGIRPGAIVILDDSKGNPHHAMFWTGKRDENGEPQLIGFNGMGAEEESNVALSYAKSGKARIGTIIDIGGMVAVSMEKREPSQKLTFEQIIETVSDAEMMQGNIASRLAEVRGKLAALRGNREEEENPTPEKTAATAKRREPQGQDKLNIALLNRMQEQKMDGKP